MFPMRAQKLYEIYRACASLEAIPAAEREKLEKTIFRAPLEDIWQITRDYFQKRAPQQVARAEQDPKHRMALVFRWYLGQAAHWSKKRRISAQDRLPDLVRPGHGRLQRMGRRFVPGNAPPTAPWLRWPTTFSSAALC